MSTSQFAQVTLPYTYIIQSKTIVIAAKCRTATNSKTFYIAV